MAIDHVQGLGQRDLLEHGAAAHGELRAGPQEEGHVGAHRAGDLVAQTHRQVELEEPVEGDEGGGGVGAAAAQAGRRRHALGDGQAHVEGALEPPLELAHRPGGEVVLAGGHGAVDGEAGAGRRRPRRTRSASVTGSISEKISW